MTEQNFLFLFGREAADSIFHLEKLKVKECNEILLQINSIRTKRTKLKDKLNELLYNDIGGKQNAKVRNKMLNLKRDIYNDRKINIENLGLYLSKEFMSKFERYLYLLKTEENLINKGRTVFAKEREEITINLFELAKKDYLTKGLLLSSSTLLNRLQKREIKKYKDFHKKDHRIEYSLIQYISRCLTKTSPFSTFNTTICYKKEAKLYKPFPPERKSVVQLNGAILYYVKKIICSCPIAQRHVTIKVNPTYKDEGDHYSFLHNKDNNEYFKKVASSEFVSYLISNVSKSPKSLIQIIHTITDVVEADEKTLKSYILKLIEIGILEWEFHVYISDIYWPDKLIDYLKILYAKDSTIDYLPELIIIIERIKENGEKIEKCSLEDRMGYIKDVYHSWKAFYSKFKWEGIKSVINENNIYYENYVDTPEKGIKVQFVEKIKNELNLYFKALSSDIIGKWNNLDIELYFKFKYGKNASVPVLQFYEDYYFYYKKNPEKVLKDDLKTNNSFLLLKLKKENSLMSKVQSEFRSIVQNPNNVFLKEEVFLSHKISKEILRKRYKSAYFQVVRDGEKPLIVINNVIHNIAQAISRFLYSYDSEITRELKRNINNLYSEGINVGLRDASMSNINIFPELVDNYIDSPNNQGIRINSKGINLNDLIIEEENDILKIKNKSKKAINVLNFSLENIHNKSELFQLLNAISSENDFGLALLNQIINSSYSKQEQSVALKMLPRIYFGEHIIIQRKTWILHSAILPNSIKDEWEYFVAINQFVKENDIPEEVFVTISKREIEPKNDDYKPQYINFGSPVFVKLFKRLTSKAQEKITIVEMLPNSNDIQGIEEKKVREYIL